MARAIFERRGFEMPFGRLRCLFGAGFRSLSFGRFTSCLQALCLITAVWRCQVRGHERTVPSKEPWSGRKVEPEPFAAPISILRSLDSL